MGGWKGGSGFELLTAYGQDRISTTKLFSFLGSGFTFEKIDVERLARAQSRGQTGSGESLPDF